MLRRETRFARTQKLKRSLHRRCFDLEIFLVHDDSHTGELFLERSEEGGGRILVINNGATRGERGNERRTRAVRNPLKCLVSRGRALMPSLPRAICAPSSRSAGIKVK